MEKEELNVGLLYISLHNLLRKKAGISRCISKKDFFTILGKHFLIPKNIRIVIIKEMEERKLVKQENQNNIKILDCEVDLEKDTSKFYQRVGLFSFF